MSMTARDRRRLLAQDTLAGYVHGPAAGTQATALALHKIVDTDPGTLILVEGISDQVAVETLANRLGRDLDQEGVVVLPVGGAEGFARFLRRFGCGPDALDLVGLCDAAEAETLHSAITQAGLRPSNDAQDLGAVGLYTCAPDLEGELIRAAGVQLIEQVLEDQGELKSFRTLQKQPAWRGSDPSDQMHRFIRAAARRSSRYARLLVEVIELKALPEPLVATLQAA